LLDLDSENDYRPRSKADYRTAGRIRKETGQELSVDPKKYKLYLKDEADDQALHSLGRKRRFGGFDYLGILMVTGAGIYGLVSGGYSITRAGQNAGEALLAYIALRFIYWMADIYQDFVALQYRTRLINQRLTEIEENLDKLEPRH
jgi:hypothetical protein